MFADLADVGRAGHRDLEQLELRRVSHLSARSTRELDPQELIADADVVAVLERRRPGKPNEASVRASEIGQFGNAAVPCEGCMAPRHERIIPEHDVAFFTTEHDFLGDQMPSIAVPAGGNQLEEPSPWLARRRT